MARQINYVALVAGILSLILVAVSWFTPWWQFVVGHPTIASVNFSPVNFNFSLFNNLLVIPLIFALNIAALLTLLAGGIAMLFYSLTPPTKSYSTQILGFAYKKPLYALILFFGELGILYVSATLLTGLSFPFVGTGILSLPSSIAPGGISVSVSVSAAFGWTFYLAIAVVVLCIIARVYHRKLVKAPIDSSGNISVTPTTTLNPPPPPPASF